jgi:hypothetical protein
MIRKYDINMWFNKSIEFTFCADFYTKYMKSYILIFFFLILKMQQIQLLPCSNIILFKIRFYQR